MSETGNTIQKERIDSIQNLEKDKLFDLIKTIILSLGYTNLEQYGDLFSAQYSGPLSKHRHAFVFFEEKLNSSELVSQYARQIEKYVTDHNILTYFVFSNRVITKGFQAELSAQLPKLTIDYLGRDELIELTEKHSPDFWKHDDLKLLAYERFFCDNIHGDNDLKKLQIFNEKYDRLLQIFIEPNFYHFYEEKSTATPIRKKVSLDNICTNSKPIVLSGDAGVGKTTSLKKIGENLINMNKAIKNKKNLPIFISITELFEANYDVESLLKSKLNTYFGESLQEIFDKYRVILLIDTIDELEEVNQNQIIAQLEKLNDIQGINFAIATRNHEKLFANPDVKDFDNFTIEKFSNEQIRRFISSFFSNQQSRAEALLDALRDNRILERLPITPLTLSLISILYEENNLEIPATITDIYDNFSAVLLGKAVVSSRLEFIDSTFRERILSLYGLALLERNQHAPMSKEEFIAYFEEYYRDKTIPVRKGELVDVLEYLINNTGILYIKNGKYVQFNHDSFMEYYGAVEIFKHQREKERLFVEHFFDINWQNASFFYGGKSRDMPAFLGDVINVVKQATKLNDFFLGVNGLGYLMQSLYQTDNKIRRDGVKAAVNTNLLALETMMKLSADDTFMFKNFKLPVFLLMNVFYFYENFNSITLKEPLILAFRDYLKLYLENPNTNNGYRGLKIALTLNSKRINEVKPLEDLVLKSNLTNDPSLALLTELALDFDRSENYKELKRAIKKEYKKLSDPIKRITEIPAGKLRFSNYDTIRSERKVVFLTEGKTDARILEHAFMILSNGSTPYWEVRSSGDESGGAKELAKALDLNTPLLSEGQILIGLFDRDAKGIAEFKGLRNFEDVENHTIRKHRSRPVYAICLPAISSRENYLQDKQDFNFLEIEHYFPDDFLNTENKLKPTSIPGIFEIAGNKNAFATKVTKETDPALFMNFLELFRRIDQITGVDVIYLEG